MAKPRVKQMNADTIQKENAEFVLARLRLAQAILEESDFLEGRLGYNFESDKWWLHPRHEREALVTYLLLTCFDRLGQERSFTALSDWLKSKKQRHKVERDRVLDSLPPDATPLDAACALVDEYQFLYGVRNAFYQGINNLSEKGKQELFSSINLSRNPQYGSMPGTSTPGYPLQDANLERDLKLKYLYDKRNRFTHRLDQYHSSSIPLLSDIYSSKGSSWAAEIRDGQLFYWGVHQEHESLKSGGAYVYTINDWPFVLFEVLYGVIGVPFERTSIKLKFKVRLFSSATEIVGVKDGVEHSRLKDFQSLVVEFWANRPEKVSPADVKAL